VASPATCTTAHQPGGSRGGGLRGVPPLRGNGRRRGEADETSKGGEGDGTAIGGASLESFLDELIVQRELCVNFAIHEPRYETFDAVPDWGKKTLAAHADDPRETILSRDQLEACETPDRLWNAAQRQMIHEGYLPNRLRMYWAKQIPHWTATAEEAHAHTVHLNDRYFVTAATPPATPRSPGPSAAATTAPSPPTSPSSASSAPSASAP
jgi:hypothetical protein